MVSMRSMQRSINLMENGRRKAVRRRGKRKRSKKRSKKGNKRNKNLKKIGKGKLKRRINEILPRKMNSNS